MSRADTATLSPAEAIGEEHEKTLRQFAIAAGVSLVAHALVLLLFVEPSYEEARLAGGGASFGLSGGGLGEGADTAPPSETDALEEKAEEAATEMSEAMEAGPRRRPARLSRARRPSDQGPAHQARRRPTPPAGRPDQRAALRHRPRKPTRATLLPTPLRPTPQRAVAHPIPAPARAAARRKQARATQRRRTTPGS